MNIISQHDQKFTPPYYTLKKGESNSTLQREYDNTKLKKEGTGLSLRKEGPMNTQTLKMATTAEMPHEEYTPKLVRTNSIYPTLDHSRSFSSVLRGFIHPENQVLKKETHNLVTPTTPGPSTIKIQKRKEHWENQFNFEFNKEVMNAELEGRIANGFSAAEKAAKQCMLEIPKIVMYNFRFHPELAIPTRLLAKQIWNHFETFGF